MRKFLAIVILLFFTVSYAVNPAHAVSGATVLQFSARSAIQTASVVKIPALVQTAAGAAKWIPLAVGAAQIAPVLGAVVVGGIVSGVASQLIIEAAKRFFPTGNGETLVQGNQVGSNVSSYPPPSGYIYPYSPNTFCGYYLSSSGGRSAAMTAISNKSVSDGHAPITGGDFNPVGTGWNGVMASPSGVNMFYWALYCTSNSCGTGVPSPNYTFIPYTSTDLSNQISAAITANNASVLPLIREGLNEINNSLQGLPSSLTAAQRAQAQTMLNDAVTQSQKDEIDALTPKTPEEIAAAIEAKANASLTSSDVAAGVQQALISQQLSRPDMQAAVDAALKLNPALTQAQVQAAFSGALSANPNLTPAQVQSAVSAALAANPGITQAQMQAAMAAALASNPSSGASPEQIKNAVKEALNDETGVEAPVDSPITLPTKLSLTGIMESFYNSINNLPIVSTFTGINMQVSGANSNLCISVPMGVGQRCYDASQASGPLQTAGNGILSIVTFWSVLGLFRGGK